MWWVSEGRSEWMSEWMSELVIIFIRTPVSMKARCLQQLAWRVVDCDFRQPPCHNCPLVINRPNEALIVARIRWRLSDCWRFNGYLATTKLLCIITSPNHEGLSSKELSTLWCTSVLGNWTGQYWRFDVPTTLAWVHLSRLLFLMCLLTEALSSKNVAFCE